MTQNSENGKRHFNTLNDIRDYKDELRQRIDANKENIEDLWHDLFHREEAPAKTKMQKLARMINLSSGMIDGALLGWKLYRKFQEGAFSSKKRRR